ncbi:MAG: metallophosphoesterase [Polyangiaceae bacterium]|nr:metallophosphoesterase [Polyangiaceae bacterium]
MLKLSEQGAEAEQQVRAVIFYLTTFGYIDGDFDDREQAFVREYIQRLVTARVEGAIDAEDGELRAELIGRYTAHFHEVFETINRQVRDLFTESVADGEDSKSFVHARLKLRCFEIFQAFDQHSQELLMDTIDELIRADGQVHPAEVEFRSEIAFLLEADLGVELLEEPTLRDTVAVAATRVIPPGAEDHPFLQSLEFNYSAAPERLREQVARDRALLDRVMEVLDRMRSAGSGRLEGKKSVVEFAGADAFLDGHVHVCPAKLGRAYDLTVLGDLHGCYSCLKAALMQSRFFDKVAAFKADPQNHPDPKLVLLGDYIDRGMFSYQGVLRAVLQVFVAAPQHVYMLRGNHEYYLAHEGRVYGGVRPAEAINTLRPHLPFEVFEHYMRLFDALPNLLLFERFLFVHGGLPRDSLLKDRYRDLSSLNDPDLRFQMMWSDPSSADVIPTVLQHQSARFPFGRLQAQAFLQRLGCHTLVRGHEKVNEGFRRVYDDDNQLVITLFSAGGLHNDDLPPDSSYRTVTPMAMTLRFKDGASEIVPWRIDYEAFNDPDRNAFFRSKPEIEHRAE